MVLLYPRANLPRGRKWSLPYGLATFPGSSVAQRLHCCRDCRCAPKKEEKGQEENQAHHQSTQISSLLLGRANRQRSSLNCLAAHLKSYSNSFSTVDCLHSTSIRNGEFATFNTKTLSYRGPLFSQKYAISEKLAKDASRYLLSSILMIGALGKPKGS